MSDAAWIAVDWGTSHLRAWIMGAEGAVLSQHASDDGMGTLTPDGFAPALKRLVGDLDLPVIACGMAGSRQGWAEAPYVAVPCKPPGLDQATRVGKVHILPGMRQDQPPEVMRGEETQIAGFLSRDKDFDGVICLPGTHTKWAHISAGEVVSFRTAMSGELFALLAERSILRHSVEEGWDAASFLHALSETLSRPESLAVGLFGIRAADLLHEVGRGGAFARLSGLLIGAELAAMRPYWLGQQVAVIGADRVARIYEQALAAQGVAVRLHEGDEMTLLGLKAAHRALEGA